jgi:hypothetical protein
LGIKVTIGFKDGTTKEEDYGDTDARKVVKKTQRYVWWHQRKVIWYQYTNY